ncbi:radical SAM protein [Candidatus Borrarchaeum sp.]|uniref:B12-binding domain-containing radical SAM protein n=1 Tax=Candidatus Borrarchaeum sp. TaxID=2846742 RepID=UPI00257B2337|nr:radical SAM protein [Candidatus Borrarchaeum sp.]
MEVLLISPPGGYVTKDLMPPLGLAYIASILENAENSVAILDAEVEKLSWRSLEKKILEYKPIIAGVTFTTATRFEGFKTARIIKKALPECKVIVGGPHATLTANDTLSHIREIDVVVRGEGEVTMGELVSKIKNNENLKKILGISYRDHEIIYHNPDRPFIEDLDSIPFPARHLLKMDKYNLKLKSHEAGSVPATNLITSRGCPFACSFCSTTRVWGIKWRARSSNNVIDEIEHLMRKYRFRGFYFFDDTFTVNKARVYEICNLIEERDLDIRWNCEIRVDTVDKNVLKAMKDTGCVSVSYGVESGSQVILDNIIRKRIILDQVRKVTKWCNELDIKVKAFFMYSLPSEKLSDVKKTLELRKSLNAEYKPFSPLRIYPGTEIEELAIAKGILPKDFTWTKLQKGNALHAEYHKNGWGVVPLFRELLSISDLFKIQSEIFQADNVNIFPLIPRYLKRIRSIFQLKRHLLGALIYFRKKLERSLNL